MAVAEDDPRWGSVLLQLRYGTPENRLEALRQISAGGASARTQVAPLFQLVGSDVSVAALEAIAGLELPDALREASTSLEYDDVAGHIAFQVIVARMGVESPVFDLLVDLVGSYNRSVAEAAMAELERIGIEAAPQLIEAYSRVHWDFEQALSHVLTSYGPAVVPLLVAAAQRGARGPIHALGIFGEGDERDDVAGDVVPTLTALLDQPGDFVSSYALDSLARFGPAAASAVSALVDRLEVGPADERGAVIAALRAIGPAAAPALPAVRRLVRDHHHWTRQEATGFVDDFGGLP